MLDMKKIQNLFSIVLGNGEMNIYRRILRTALFGTLLTFFVMAIIFFCSMFILRANLEVRGKELSEQVGYNLEEVIQKEVKKNILETTLLRTQLVERLLQNTYITVENITGKMIDILEHPEDHVEKNLPVANFEDISALTPYVFYTPKLLEQGISEDLRQEILHVSSIDDDIKKVSHFYGSVVIVSDKGYVIRMDAMSADNGKAVLCREPLRSTYDPKERSWYKETLAENKMFLSNPYIASYGKPCISVCSPYYVDNDFAGVIVLDIDVNYLNERITTVEADDPKFNFIMGRNGAILISPQNEGIFSAGNMDNDLRKSENKTLAFVAERMVAKENGVTFIEADGTEYYLAYAPIGDTGWSLGTVFDKNAITQTADILKGYTDGTIEDYNNSLIKFFLFITIVAIIIFIIIVYFILKINIRMAKGFVAPIDLLTKGVREISGGNLKKTLEIKTGDEIETLAESFNHMTTELSQYMENLAATTAKNQRIKTELSVATKIQAGMLPNGKNPFPKRKDFELSAFMTPAKEVGGDFYDFYFLDKNHLVITVADVSDKGVPAALFMVISKTLLKEHLLVAGNFEKLGEVFEETNNALIKSNEEGMFVTVFTGILDLVSGEFIYANAGHNPPIIRQNGKCRYFENAKSPIMAIVEGLNFEISKINLKSGDALFLYTDGVTEARNEQKKLFGEKRLLDTFSSSNGDAEQDIKNVRDAVKNFAGDARQSDDITMLEVIYKKGMVQDGNH